MKTRAGHLSPDELLLFIRQGFLHIPGAFSEETAAACRSELWSHLEKDGIVQSDPSTWVMKHSLSNIFTSKDGPPWSHVSSQRLISAVADVLGEDVSDDDIGFGWWMITFPGFSSPPWCVDGRWHVDGYWYQHYPFSKEIGLVLIMLFSDVLPGGGGTAVAEGSHRCVARGLAEAGLRGAGPGELACGVSTCMESGSHTIHELTGSAGDVYLMHPFLIHARSSNLGKQDELAAVRFMCHPSVPLKAHMNFDQDPSNMSPLETSIYTACEGYSYFPKGSDESLHSSTADVETDDKLLKWPWLWDCGCCFHTNGEDLRPMLRCITPAACEDLVERKRKRSQEDSDEDEVRKNNSLESVQGSDDDRSRSHNHNSLHTSNFSDDSICDEAVSTAGVKCVVSTVGIEQIATVMGFGGFSSSRREYY